METETASKQEASSKTTSDAKKIEEPVEVTIKDPQDATQEFSPLGPVISSLLGDDDGEEEDEDEDLLVREICEPIDREAYIAEYSTLMNMQCAYRRKNQFLQFKLSAYYKKRKMDDVFKEEEIVEDMQTKYDKKLDDLCSLREKAFREQTEELEDINYMQEQCKEQTEISQKEFKAMQNQEKDTAKGLIDTRTGKIIAEKQVERLITRQNTKRLEIAEIRLNYIRKREKVKNLENQLRSLETIDGNLHLIEYEQLRMENQNFTDKIEERDDELSKLRTRYNVAVQALAHVREKSYITDQNIEDLIKDQQSAEDELTYSREHVNDFKIRRDANRSETNKLKAESGLLTYTRLLNDMHTSMEEVNKITKEVTMLKETNKENRRKLDAIRRTIEYYLEKTGVGTSIKPSQSTKTTTTNRVYRGRPSLMLPTLPTKKLNFELFSN